MAWSVLVAGLGETTDQLFLRAALWIIGHEDSGLTSVNPDPTTIVERAQIENWIRQNTPFTTDAEVSAYFTLQGQKKLWLNTRTGSWGWYLQQAGLATGTNLTGTPFPWGTLAGNVALVSAGAAIAWIVFAWKPKAKKHGRKKKGYIHELLFGK